jgi:hypothetical protein
MCFEGIKVLVRLLYVKIILITKYYHYYLKDKNRSNTLSLRKI